jgi:hypothetical protein
VSRSHRIYIDQPASLVDRATDLAESAGHPLSPFVHAAIIAAVRAAEAGRGDALPKPPPRRPVRPDLARVAITASRADRQRWTAAMESAGTTLPAVVTAALEAFVKVGGSWADTPMPGEAGGSWRAAGAA